MNIEKLQKISDSPFGLLQLYPTPVYSAQFQGDDLNKIQTELLSAYTELKTQDSFKQKDGWASHFLSDPTFTGNLFEVYQCPFFLEMLDAHIHSYLFNLGVTFEPEYEIMSSWLTLTTKGQYGHIHNHGASDISGCYYVQTTGKDGNFNIPCSQKPLDMSRIFSNLSRSATIEPVVGKMMLFPGWMDHGVGTNTTDSERVSLSFNIKFKDIKPQFNPYKG